MISNFSSPDAWRGWWDRTKLIGRDCGATYGTTAERKEDAGEGEAQPRWPLGLRVPAVVDTPDDDSTRTIGDHVQVKLELPEHNHELYAEFKKHGIAFGAELICKDESPCGPPQPVAEFEGAAVGP